MRDDSSPPPTRNLFDSEMAHAMSDIPLPAGLTERLQTAVRATSIQAVPDVTRQRIATHWSRRRILSGGIALVIVATWSWFGLREATLTEADVRRLAELDVGSLLTAPSGTKFSLPSGWHSLPGVELAEQPVIEQDDALSLPLLPLAFRASRRAPRVTGLLLTFAKSRWSSHIEATSLPTAEVRYTASGTWAIWREGTTMFVCVLHGNARYMEALQVAASSREVS